ncbi:MAG TPA: hypothetical protein VHI71_01750 [Actinomycetota bacterium]|nr:hypothetical protein [Actinomycetota bacterium]
MTSSPLPSPPKPGDAPDPPPTKWPRWRISMLVGALILLVAAILDAAMDELPRPLYFVLFGVGYVFLAYGFFTALGARREGSNKK